MNISADALAAIQAHARDAGEHECCGLLIGNRSRIEGAVRASNQAGDPATRYVIDPADHFAAIRTARAVGLEVVGAYHSHPRSEPVPSETDLAEAFADFVFVIAGRVEDARPASGVEPHAREVRRDWSAERQPSHSEFLLRAWQLRGGNFVELALVCDS